MKTEFKAKFLQHVAKRKREGGFTLIELLVVIIIIGILSAIALPSFLNQANKAKQSEAKQYLSSINKGLQAHFAENSDFENNEDEFVAVDDLGLGIKTETTNYRYELVDGGTTAVDNIAVSSTAKPAAAALRAYAGGVGIIQAGEGTTTTTILCEQVVEQGEFTADVNPPTIEGTGENAVIVCGGEQTEVTK